MLNGNCPFAGMLSWDPTEEKIKFKVPRRLALKIKPKTSSWKKIKIEVPRRTLNIERGRQTSNWSQKVNFEKKATFEKTKNLQLEKIKIEGGLWKGNEKPPTGARPLRDNSPRRGFPSRCPSALLPVGQVLGICQIFHTSKILCGKGACQECKRFKKNPETVIHSAL